MLWVSLPVVQAEENTATLGGIEEVVAPTYCVKAIDFLGLERTKQAILHGELASAGVRVGKAASPEAIEAGVQKIRNLGVFREVLYDTFEVVREELQAEQDAPAVAGCAGHPAARLTIQLDEKWTALPLFSFSRGGGTYRLILGAYDVNFLGRYINLGAQYERLGDTNSFFTWISPQRLLGRDLIPALSLGSRNRVYRLYDPDGTVAGGFLLNRFSVTGSLLKEWSDWFRTSVSLRFEDDDFSLDLLSEQAREAQIARGLPDSSQALLVGAIVTVGRLNRNNFLVDGQSLTLGVNHGNEHLGSTDAYRDLLLGYRYFKSLPLKSTIGFRLAGGFASTDAVHRRFFLGGLDAIRGFASDRFNGNNYWLSSVEFRIPSVDTRWFVLQHIFFVDAAGVSESVGDLAKLSGASAGTGIRIIVPKIQDFVVRIDYAFPLYDVAANPLGFGGGQYF
ncbi:BamA/TamA family outer membrane protein [Bradymonas sediminis]|uniref:Uncharacterized protein n=1 Tax=Bradymonas sediminis TaxID=1548548 RepID=A0A2Z4FJN9_9DELT|nr:BamA/TamA family outer membrane protein [Bradymonas sediminis]AWV89149.1 hypothetical protein DN745_07280 [Bradymonas sediminis]TDP64385.1 surface antigen-like protein [Bradymonas sediminis]